MTAETNTAERVSEFKKRRAARKPLVREFLRVNGAIRCGVHELSRSR
jgi:hypothetical protein